MINPNDQLNGRVAVVRTNCYSYPHMKYKYAPSKHYPEYSWNDLSPENNEVYDMVREALHLYGLDENNYGRKEWNPFKTIIHKGDTVLVKPNWVMHYNEKGNAGIECLYTNTSITRAIVDYVAIALSGTGRIIVADSPMPDCDFNIFSEKAGLKVLQKSCQERGISISIRDLRGDVVHTFSKEKINVSGASGTEINIGNESYFSEKEVPDGHLRYSFLDAHRMNEYYHTKQDHIYVISDSALEADVIINLPKIKTHRKAGYTAALKNYIGICYKKDAIPHFVKGNTKEGGDEYNGPKIVFELESNIRDIENKYEAAQKRMVGLALKALRTPFWLYRRLFAKQYQGIGNWHGNDTIWRAVLDINSIIYYSNKRGQLQNRIQRRFFSLGDMIIAGQRNGPLSPEPKSCGTIICSEDPIAFDKVVTTMMGFNAYEIPIIKGIGKDKLYGLPIVKDELIFIVSNDSEINGKTLQNLVCAFDRPFLPADGWEKILFENGAKK